MKKTQTDKIIDQLQAEIADREKMIALLVNAQSKSKKRERKPKIAAVPAAAAQ